MQSQNMNMKTAIKNKVILDNIYKLRNQQVMLDRDLATLYGVETKRLKEAVRRNLSRFPKDFMFEMTRDELQHWRSNFASSKSEKMGIRIAPFCFTEQGVTMLSCVLNSQRAIEVNIRIIRTFSKMREVIITKNELTLEIEVIRQKVSGQDEKIERIFDYLKQFVITRNKKRTKIGYK